MRHLPPITDAQKQLPQPSCTKKALVRVIAFHMALVAHFCSEYKPYPSQHSVIHQLHADTTQRQLYKPCCPNKIIFTFQSVEKCISCVQTCKMSDKLQVNGD